MGVMARARARVIARAARGVAKGKVAAGATPTGLSHPTSVGSGRSQQPRALIRIPNSPQLARRNHRTHTAHDETRPCGQVVGTILCLVEYHRRGVIPITLKGRTFPRSNS